jgi:hypothetical protein
MALSDSEKQSGKAALQFSGRGELVPPPRDYSPLAKAVLDNAASAAAKNPHVSRPRLTPEQIGRQFDGANLPPRGRATPKILGTPAGRAFADSFRAEKKVVEREMRSDPLATRNATKEKWGKRLTGTLCSVCEQPQYESPSGPTCNAGHGGAPGQKVTFLTPQDDAYFANKENEPKGGALYGVGPVDQDHDPGFAPVFDTLDEAYEFKGESGDGVWMIPKDQKIEPQLLDVWSDDRRIHGTRVPPGWAVNQAREECLDMAKASSPKKSFGSTTTRAPVTAASQTVDEPVLQSDDVPGSEVTQPAEEQPKTGKQSKRNSGEAPAVQEGESLDDVKARMQKANTDGEQVFIAIGKTVNVGNYESVRIDVGIVRALADGQSFDDLKGDVASEVFELLMSLKAEVVTAVEGGQL